MFEKCNDEEKIKIAHYLRDKWTNDEGQIIMNRTFEEQKIFDSYRCFIRSPENVKSFIDWANEVLKNFHETSTEDINTDFLIEKKKEMIERVKSELQKGPKFNNKIDLSDEPVRSLKDYCHKTQNDMYAKTIIDSFAVYLLNLAKKNISIEIDEEKSQVSSLNDEEIKITIDNKFKKEGEQYLYNGNIPMTRNNLFNIIKKKYFVMRLAYRMKKVDDNSEKPGSSP
jgi:hypothetical protein